MLPRAHALHPQEICAIPAARIAPQTEQPTRPREPLRTPRRRPSLSRSATLVSCGICQHNIRERAYAQDSVRRTLACPMRVTSTPSTLPAHRPTRPFVEPYAMSSCPTAPIQRERCVSRSLAPPPLPCLSLRDANLTRRANDWRRLQLLPSEALYAFGSRDPLYHRYGLMVPIPRRGT